MEETENPVNRLSMALERNSSYGCFTYFPKSQQFKMCFNASTTNTQCTFLSIQELIHLYLYRIFYFLAIHPNDIQEILIDRGIFYGNIR